MIDNIYSKNKSFTCEIMKENKEIHDNFAVKSDDHSMW